MGRNKIDKRSNASKALEGNTNNLQTGTTPKTKFNNWMINNGMDLQELAPKMEKYTSMLDWNNDSMAYMAAKAEVLEKMTALYQTIGGKAADIQTEIMKLSYFIDMLEKKLLEDSIIPIESKEYMKAVEQKHKLVTELNKLKLDYVTRTDDKNFKDSKKEESDDMW